MKLQTSLFMEDIKMPDDDILSFFRKLCELYTRKIYVTQIKRDGITEMEFETARIPSLSDVFPAVAVVPRVRDLTKPRRRRQRERQKTIGLMSKTTTLHVHHAFLYISLPSLHNCDVK